MRVTLTHLIHMLNVRSYCSGINTEQAGVNGGLILTLIFILMTGFNLF